MPPGHDFLAARLGRLAALLTLLVSALLAAPIEPASVAGRGQGPVFSAATTLPSALVPRPLSVLDALPRLPDDGGSGKGGDRPAAALAGEPTDRVVPRTRLSYPRPTIAFRPALPAGRHYRPRAPPFA